MVVHAMKTLNAPQTIVQLMANADTWGSSTTIFVWMMSNVQVATAQWEPVLVFQLAPLAQMITPILVYLVLDVYLTKTDLPAP